VKISLAPTLRGYVEEQVTNGRYLNESEVVRAALRRMEAQVPVISNLEQGLSYGDDNEDLVSLVMMEASESAHEDLRELLAGIHAINARRARLQRLITKMKRDGADNVGGEDLQAIKEALKSAVDSLSEMGEMESLRLQMAMDRLSKLISTLSNILKKTTDTASSLVQNLK
jgi:putative addiction module CopG family antidote